MPIKFARRKDDVPPIANDDGIVYSDNVNGNDAHFRKNGRFAPKNINAREEHRRNLNDYYDKLRRRKQNGENIAPNIYVENEEAWNNLTDEQKNAINDALYSKCATECALYQGYNPIKAKNYKKTKDWQFIKRLADNYMTYDGQKDSFKPFRSSDSYEEALKRFQESAKLIGKNEKGVPNITNIDSNVYSPYAASVAIPQIMQEFWDKGIPCDVVKNPYAEEDKRGIDYWFYFKDSDGTIFRRNVDQKVSKGDIKLELYSDNTKKHIDEETGKRTFGDMNLESLFNNLKKTNDSFLPKDMESWGMKNITPDSISQRYISGRESIDALSKTLEISPNDLKRSEGSLQNDMLTDDYLFINYSDEGSKYKVSNAFISKQELHKTIKNAFGNPDMIIKIVSQGLIKAAAYDLNIDGSNEFINEIDKSITKTSKSDKSVIYSQKFGPFDFVLEVFNNNQHTCRLYLETNLKNIADSDSILNIDHYYSNPGKKLFNRRVENGAIKTKMGDNSVDEYNNVYYEDENGKRKPFAYVRFAKRKNN